MRIIVLVTITTLMLACFAPAFAEGESAFAAVEPEVTEQVLQEPLQLANEPSLEVTSGPIESAPVDYTVQSYEVQPAEARAYESVFDSPVQPTQVVYTTQSNTLEDGYIRPYSIVGTTSVVPEPSSILALAAGIGGLAFKPLRRRSK